MAEFKSFADLGHWFDQGMTALGQTTGAKYAPTYAGIAKFDAALQTAGRHFEDHFKQKIDQNGPGWAPMSEVTEKLRQHYGVEGDGLLNATGELRDSIKSQVTFNNTVEIGVEDKIHLHPNGKDMIMTSDLMVMMETGFPTGGATGEHEVPARPVFTADDFEIFATLVTEEFVAEVFGNKAVRGRDSRGRFTR